MRQNIFELLSSNELDIRKEYNRIKKLFEESKFYAEHTLLTYINKYVFLNWRYRRRFLSVSEMMSELKISDFYFNLNINIDILIRYIEFVSNMLLLIEDHSFSNSAEQIRKTLKENIDNLLEDLNYQLYKNTDGQIIVIEKDNKSTATAEKFQDISDEIIEYRRFALKGKLEDKKEILLKLSEKIEPLRKKFNGNNYKNIIEDINMLLNNLNIRHNNIEGKNRQEYTVNMTKEELESWYDITYDLILCALMLDDYVDNKKSIGELRTHY